MSHGALFLRRIVPSSAVPYLRFSPAVKAALLNGDPLVALESTIVCHGMPFPRSLETALAVEAEVTRKGAVPATIAVMNGLLHIGLSSAELEVLARAGASARKTSRRDLASVLAGGGMGATTVSGTMIAAHLARISVFATGGIGGVHRGGESTMDVSADLSELGRTPVTVVCAGVKSILDIGRTLEVLETQGVPVVTYRSDTFPAFFSHNSGHASPHRVDSTGAIARMLITSSRLGLRNGMLVAVPAPSHAPEVDAAIDAALAEADAQHIVGAAITPFLLARVTALTEGASLEANIELVLNNAKVAASIAVDVLRLEGDDAAGRGRGRGVEGGAKIVESATTLSLKGTVVRERLQPSRSRGSIDSGGRGSGGSSGSERMSPLSPPPSATSDTAQVEEVLRPSRTLPPPLVTPPLSASRGASVSVSRTTTRAPRATTRRTFSTSSTASSPTTVRPRHANGVPSHGPIVVVGGAVLDSLAFPSKGTPLVHGTSNPGRVLQSAGGVGRNVAEAVARLGGEDVVLISALGEDAAGSTVSAACAAAGVRVLNVAPRGDETTHTRTASYAALLDGDGELVAAVADMDAFEHLTPHSLGLSNPSSPINNNNNTPAAASCTASALFSSARLVVVDANVPAHTLRAITGALHDCGEEAPVLVYEPVSVAKCVRVVDADALRHCALVKPNIHEVFALAHAWRAREHLPPIPAAVDGALAAAGAKEEVEDSEGGEVCDDAVEESCPFPLDDRVLMASQTVLAAMLQWEKEKSTGAPTRRVGGLIDGRKHVLVSLGRGGLLWLSSPPLMTHDDTHRAHSLPFFNASRDVGFDFRLCPPPHIAPRDLAKATGAGDSLLGSVITSVAVRGEGMACAVRWGLAAAQAALETRGPAIPLQLRALALERVGGVGGEWAEETYA